MKMIQLLFCTLAALQSLAIAGPIPDAAMQKATTVEEFLALQKGLEGRQRGSPDSRIRALQEVEPTTPKLAGEYDGPAGFYHGVASGDPLPTQIIIWTRWTPENADDTVDIELRMAKVDADLAVEDHLDPAKNSEIKRALISTSGTDDWIVKLDVTGLEPATAYVFGFLGPNGETSRVGLTKTAPAEDADVDQVQYAVFSCAHFSNGYFHAYDIASTLTDLDFWIHMGDYIYEYGTYSTYANGSPERHSLTDPIWEIVELNDYRRRYAQYHRDEGLQNLRARAPQLSIWDDHETMNDSHGDGNPDTSGAENHQEVCPVNRTSPDEEKEAENCDRDEGPIEVRLNTALKAYMEWMPIRKGPFDNMGFVEGDLTQVIEWGKLATFVLLDTRVSERSSEPTGDTTFAFFGAAFVETNVTKYDEEPLLSAFQGNSEAAYAAINNENYTMIGSKVDFMEEVFAASKAAGKPWQVYGSATMMGPLVPPNMADFSKFIEDPVGSATVQAVVDFVLPSPDGALFRAAVAMAKTGTTWNLDDYNGFGHERKQILDMFQESTNNPIVLGGDLHDNWAWTMYEGGELTGTPVALNLGAPGVASPGWGSFFEPIFSSVQDAIGGEQGIYELGNAAFMDVNPGLKYADIGKKGFFVVTSTAEQSDIEFYGMPPKEILVPFEEARAANDGSITAAYSCGAHLVSIAGQPGSLNKVDECVTSFDSERPAVWAIPLTASDSEPSFTASGCGGKTCVVDAADLKETEDETDDESASSNMRLISSCAIGIVAVVLAMV